MYLVHPEPLVLVKYLEGYQATEVVECAVISLGHSAVRVLLQDIQHGNQQCLTNFRKCFGGQVWCVAGAVQQWFVSSAIVTKLLVGCLYY